MRAGRGRQTRDAGARVKAADEGGGRGSARDVQLVIDGMQTRGMDQVRQLGDGFDLELAHDAGAVALDRALIDAEVAGDLLVQLSAEDVGEDFAVARGERVERGAQLVQAGALGTFAGVGQMRSSFTTAAPQPVVATASASSTWRPAS